MLRRSQRRRWAVTGAELLIVTGIITGMVANSNYKQVMDRAREAVEMAQGRCRADLAGTLALPETACRADIEVVSAGRIGESAHPCIGTWPAREPGRGSDAITPVGAGSEATALP